MKPALVDISVLLVFFARPNTFSRVFDVVRQARPSRLFLYQDGPRDDRPDDADNIAACRAIAESVDWECDIHRMYQDKNVGCDPSGYIAHTWAFSMTDKCIVIEDDIVPSVSFFSFCKAVLDKYESDSRVMLISGFNPQEITPNVTSDYFFSSTTFTWGWASWSRVVNKWDKEYCFLEDESKVTAINDYVKSHGLLKNFINMCAAHKASGKAHFETILMANQYLHNGFTVVPKKNMISNIGLSANASHYVDDIKLVPRGYRKVFTMNRYDINVSSMAEPQGMADYEPFRAASFRIYGWGHPLVKIWRLCESSFYRMIRGDFKGMLADIKDKFGKFISRRTG